MDGKGDWGSKYLFEGVGKIVAIQSSPFLKKIEGGIVKTLEELERSCTFYEHLYTPKEVLTSILVKFTHDMNDVLATPIKKEELQAITSSIVKKRP